MRYLRMRKGKRAFSLVEVLMALALFAIMGAVLLQSVLNGIHALDLVRPEGRQAEDVRFILRQILSIEDRNAFENGGEIETVASGPARWSAEIEETEVLDLFRVEVQIAIGENNQRPDGGIREVLYLYRPRWSDPIDRSILKQEKQTALNQVRPFR